MYLGGIVLRINTKRVFTIAATVVCAVALSLIIGLTPSCNGENVTELTPSVVNPTETDNTVSEAPEGTDYKNMSNDELLKVIEERDAQIEELTNKVEELTILAEQTTNSIVVPQPSISNSDDSSDDDDDDSLSSSDESSSGSSSSSGISGGSSSSGNTSDTGL